MLRLLYLIPNLNQKGLAITVTPNITIISLRRNGIIPKERTRKLIREMIKIKTVIII